MIRVTVWNEYVHEQEYENIREVYPEAQRYAAVARYMESHTATCLVRDALEQLVRYGRDKGVRITLEDFDGNTSPCARMLPLK